MSLSQTISSPIEPLSHAKTAPGIWTPGVVRGYALAIFAVALGTTINELLWPYIKPQTTPLFAAVMISAWLGGLGPGLLSTALAVTVSVYVLVDPNDTYAIDAHDVLRSSVYVATTLLVSTLNAKRKRAEAGLEAERASLELKVIERTRDLQRMNVELRDLSWQLAKTEEQERRRIATALHDGLGQLLACAAIKVDALKGSIPEQRCAEAAEIRQILDEALTQTRSLTIDLSPPVLHELGLEPAVRWMSQEMERRYDLKVEIDCPSLQPLEEATRSVLFHSIRELLINVAKHAKASVARVTILSHPTALEAVVQDDGCGFDVATVLSHADNRQRFGLFNVRERINHLGGRFDMSSQLKRGTCVRLTVPVEKLDANN